MKRIWNDYSLLIKIVGFIFVCGVTWQSWASRVDALEKKTEAVDVIRDDVKEMKYNLKSIAKALKIPYIELAND